MLALLATNTQAAIAQMGIAITDGIVAVQGPAVEATRYLGETMSAGLASGIRDNAAAVQDALQAVIDDAISAAKEALGIASPSKAFAALGQHTMEGYVQGLDEGPSPAWSRLLPDHVPALSGASPDAGGMGAVTINVYQQPGEDGAGLARRVAAILDDRERRRLNWSPA